MGRELAGWFLLNELGGVHPNAIGFVERFVWFHIFVEIGAAEEACCVFVFVPHVGRIELGECSYDLFGGRLCLAHGILCTVFVWTRQPSSAMMLAVEESMAATHRGTCAACRAEIGAPDKV